MEARYPILKRLLQEETLVVASNVQCNGKEVQPLADHTYISNVGCYRNEDIDLTQAEVTSTCVWGTTTNNDDIQLDEPRDKPTYSWADAAEVQCNRNEAQPQVKHAYIWDIPSKVDYNRNEITQVAPPQGRAIVKSSGLLPIPSGGQSSFNRSPGHEYSSEQIMQKLMAYKRSKKDIRTRGLVEFTKKPRYIRSGRLLPRPQAPPYPSNDISSGEPQQAGSQNRIRYEPSELLALRPRQTGILGCWKDSTICSNCHFYNNLNCYKQYGPSRSHSGN